MMLQRQIYNDLKIIARLFIINLMIIVSLNSCASGARSIFAFNGEIQVYAPWDYANLRLLDAPDSSQPNLDLLALYTRTHAEEFQLRLDLLEHSPNPDFDLYIVLDSTPGGAHDLPIAGQTQIAWEILLIIPADGKLQTLTPNMTAYSKSGLRVVRDPIFDTIQISLRRESLGTPNGVQFDPPIHLQVFLTAPGSKTIIDEMGPISSDSVSPQPVRVLFAFWNTFPAYSPMLALRRWDGAHTGPYGGRHGLYNLLRTAYAANIPLALLDLKAPASLTALDHLGNMEIIRSLQTAGLLILPEYIPDLPVQHTHVARALADSSLANSLQLSKNFNLRSSQFVFAPIGFLPSSSQARVVFIRQLIPALPTQQLVNLQRAGGSSLALVPGYDESDVPQQADYHGLSPDTRRTLIETAIKATIDPVQARTFFIMLGGNLPASSWGDPQIARATFQYINAHPWIHPLSAYELLNSETETQPIPSLDSDAYPLTPNLITALQAAPQNPLTSAAWQTLNSLYGPIFPRSNELLTLRNHYLGGVWSLLYAASWAESPSQIADCQHDPDQDGQAECILASEQIYAQLEISDGSLTYAFARLGSTPEQIHQFIAPTSQFVVGLSQPEIWDLSRGLFADPEVIPGAFTEISGGYEVDYLTDELHFSNPENGAEKLYRLTPNGLYAEFISLKSGAPTVSLAIDPWKRFTTDWSSSYKKETNANFFSLTLHGSLSINLRSSQPAAAYAFTDSIELLSLPENPNRDAPPGHRLPFPIILVEIQPAPQMWIEFIVQPSPVQDIIKSR